MGRNHLAHAAGDANNAVLAAAGYNFRRLPGLALRRYLRVLFAALALQSGLPQYSSAI
jgi:IS5 family transposase